MTTELVLTITPGPRNAHTDAESGLRFYRWRGRDLPSVTTIRRLAGVPFPLHQWTISQVVARAVEGHDTLTEMLNRPRRPRERVLEKNRIGEASRWLRAAATEERDAAAELGTTVHDAAAQGTPLEELPEAARPRVRRFRSWLEISGAEVLATEFQVWNLSVGYAGTGDLLVRFRDGSIWLLDLKTGSGLYAEHVLQLMGYAMAEFVGQDDQVDDRLTNLLRAATGIGILHLSDEACEFVAVRPDPDAWRAFRGLLVFATWIHGNPDLGALVLARKRITDEEDAA